MSDADPWWSTSGHDDPPDEAPWAMQLVVRAEKHARPTESDACAAAARAVVALLDDERSRDDGPWRPAVERWVHGRIRKVVRRARAHAWEKAQTEDGLTVTVGGAEVRACVPGPTDAVPLVIARLQIRGLELDDPDRRAWTEPASAAPAIVIALPPLDGFSTGKKVAAAGHAAQLSAGAMTADRYRSWAGAGHPAVVIQPDEAGWSRFRAEAAVTVADAGYTEVEPGTVTAAATWA